MPIHQVLPDVLAALASHNRLLLEAPPGAGKSTALPLALLRAQLNWRIIMLEPRRLAARNIAQYLAAQLNEPLGQTIGLHMRQENWQSANTRLLVVTEGMLTRYLQQDPELSAWHLVVFDEYHERSLAADLSLVLLKEVQEALRPELKVLVMSATLDGDKLAKFLDCPRVQSQGRSYPIEYRYHAVQPQTPWLAQLAKLIATELPKLSGSGLVFLPGKAEILKLQALLSETLTADIQLLPLYGELDKAAQLRAIAPCANGERKLVLTTNVAETSLTIEGISVVFDSLYKREMQWQAKSGMSQLQLAAISQAEATQRAGRAGRLGPGICYRLSSAEQFSRRANFAEPEIVQQDLVALLLDCKQWGADPEHFTWLDQPSAGQLAYARNLLRHFTVLDKHEQLSRYGKQVASFGLEPRLAHLLLQSQQAQTNDSLCSTACYLVAALELNSLPRADSLSQALAQAARQPLVGQRAAHWARKLKHSLGQWHSEHLAQLLCIGFPDRLAKARGQSYQLANGAGASLAADHPWQQASLLVAPAVHNGYLQWPEKVDEAWFYQTFAEHINDQQCSEFDEKTGKFTHVQRRQWLALVLQEKPLHSAISAEQRSQAWQSYLNRHGLTALLNQQAEQLWLRLQIVRQLQLSHDWPDFTEAGLLASSEQWLSASLGNVTKLEQLATLPWSDLLLARLTYQQQQQLQQWLPERLTVASGNRHSLHYQLDGPALLKVKLQEMFGEQQSPTLANGKLPVLIELLSPGQSPLQRTMDLASFWQTGYKEVQKEMKGRYPRHPWPDDPANAQATHKTKKQLARDS